MQDAFFVGCERRGELQLVIGFAARTKPGIHGFRIVHSVSGSRVLPISLNRLNGGQFSPAELDWIENLAQSLS